MSEMSGVFDASRNEFGLIIPAMSLDLLLLYNGDSNSSSEASCAMFSFNLFLFRDLDPDMFVLGVNKLDTGSPWKLEKLTYFEIPFMFV